MEFARATWVEFGKPCRMLLLVCDELFLSEERGISDARPMLAAPEDECVRDRTLYTTSRTSEKVREFKRTGQESQMGLS